MAGGWGREVTGWLVLLGPGLKTHWQLWLAVLTNRCAACTTHTCQCHTHPQVTIACLWAAFFNKLLLPWSSKDWSLEQISAALVAAARVLNNSYQLQFKAALAITAAAAAGVEAAEAPGGGSRSGSSSSGGADNTSSSKAQLAAALVAQEAALQKGLVEPVVGVQTGRWVGGFTDVLSVCWLTAPSATTSGPHRSLQILCADSHNICTQKTALCLCPAACPPTLSHVDTLLLIYLLQP